MNRLNYPDRFDLTDFIIESNKIEGIYGAPPEAEIEEAKRFLSLKQITIEDLEKFVSVYQPNARLRDKIGLNVRVGTHLPPAGSRSIKKKLQKILDDIPVTHPYMTHCAYETLHPFTDGNGRSGRILWLWCIGGWTRLGFLHEFYYQALQHSRHDLI